MNIAKLNTASLDDKTFIIKRGTSGGTTINNQDKVVDITENGTTEVVADGGYTGLGKVTINTEVSGESGGSGESSIEYFALTDGWFGDLGISTSYYNCLVKASTAQGMAIAPVQIIEVLNGNQKVTPLAIAMDMALVIKFAGQEATLKESILGSGITEEALAKYRITKEQFYSLE